MNSNNYKKSYFTDPLQWCKRAFFVMAFGYLFNHYFLDGFELSNNAYFLYIIFLVILVIIGQFDELEINSKEIVISQRSLVPFFSSKRIIKIEEIKSIRKNSNYVEGEGLWSLIHKKRKAIEIISKNGQSEIINSRMHPGGYDGLFKKIKKTMANNE